MGRRLLSVFVMPFVLAGLFAWVDAARSDGPDTPPGLDKRPRARAYPGKRGRSVFGQTAIALHARNVPSKVPCQSPNAEGRPCANYITQRPSHGSSIVYLVAIAESTGVTGISCGLDYQGGPGTGLHVESWTRCSDGLEFANAGPFGPWPGPESGIRLTWDACETHTQGAAGTHAIAGWFYCYAYSVSLLQVTPNSTLLTGPELVLADCIGAETPIPVDRAASVGFGMPGTNPCRDAQVGIVDDAVPGPGIRATPNPFRGEVQLILIDLGPDARIRIFDVLGRQIRRLENPSGSPPQFRWDGRNDHGESVPGGLYFIRADSPDLAVTQQVVLLR